MHLIFLRNYSLLTVNNLFCWFYSIVCILLIGFFHFKFFLTKLVVNRIIFTCFLVFIWFIFICYIYSVLFSSFFIYLLGSRGITLKISLTCLFCAILATFFSLKIFFVKILENIFVMLLAELTNCHYKLIHFIYFITNHLYVSFFTLGNET